MRRKAAGKSEGKVGKYVVHINGGGKTRTREFGDRASALKLAEARDAQGFLVSVVNQQGTEIFRSAPRVLHEIIRDDGRYHARIYDAPCGTWRPLFVIKDGMGDIFDDRTQALAGVRLYEDWEQKDGLIEAEIEASLKYVITDGNPDNILVPVLIYLGESGHPIYVGFHLSADFINARSDLKIIVHRSEEPAGD